MALTVPAPKNGRMRYDHEENPRPCSKRGKPSQNRAEGGGELARKAKGGLKSLALVLLLAGCAVHKPALPLCKDVTITKEKGKNRAPECTFDEGVR